MGVQIDQAIRLVESRDPTTLDPALLARLVDQVNTVAHDINVNPGHIHYLQQFGGQGFAPTTAYVGRVRGQWNVFDQFFSFFQANAELEMKEDFSNIGSIASGTAGIMLKFVAPETGKAVDFAVEAVTLPGEASATFDDASQANFELIPKARVRPKDEMNALGDLAAVEMTGDINALWTVAACTASYVQTQLGVARFAPAPGSLSDAGMAQGGSHERTVVLGRRCSGRLSGGRVPGSRYRQGGRLAGRARRLRRWTQTRDRRRWFWSCGQRGGFRSGQHHDRRPGLSLLDQLRQGVPQLAPRLLGCDRSGLPRLQL